jgi:hypothetical protein
MEGHFPAVILLDMCLDELGRWLSETWSLAGGVIETTEANVTAR